MLFEKVKSDADNDQKPDCQKGEPAKECPG